MHTPNSPKQMKGDQARLRAIFGLEQSSDHVHLISPEGVPIKANRVSPFARLGAISLDVLIQVGIIFVVLWGLSQWVFSWTGVSRDIVNIFWLFLFTFMRMPYFIFMEYYFRGQTLGKKMTKIRVMDEAGGRLRVSSLIVRNITREIEVTLPLIFMLGIAFNPFASLGWSLVPLILWLVFVSIVPFVNKDRKRLGDMLAGTIVVSVQKPALLKDIAAQEVQQSFSFSTAQLAAYGEFEVQVLQNILSQNPNVKQLKPIVAAIRKKIGYRGLVTDTHVHDFLLSFYRAQRQYLEERLLIGKRKDSKLNAETEV